MGTVRRAQHRGAQSGTHARSPPAAMQTSIASSVRAHQHWVLDEQGGDKGARVVRQAPKLLAAQVELLEADAAFRGKTEQTKWLGKMPHNPAGSLLDSTCGLSREVRPVQTVQGQQGWRRSVPAQRAGQVWHLGADPIQEGVGACGSGRRREGSEAACWLDHPACCGQHRQASIGSWACAHRARL